MAKISGTYTLRIADKDPSDGTDGATVLTIRVHTASEQDAATAAEAVGNALEKLGITVPDPRPNN